MGQTFLQQASTSVPSKVISANPSPYNISIKTVITKIGLTVNTTGCSC